TRSCSLSGRGCRPKSASRRPEAHRGHARGGSRALHGTCTDAQSRMTTTPCGGESPPAVHAQDVGMVYGSGPSAVTALRGLSLRVPRGQFVIVRGKSGSGKTTLLHLLSGLRRPSAGRIRVGGVEVQSLSEGDSARFRRRHIGLVYQFFNLVPTLSVAHNIALPLLMDGQHIGALRARVD